MNSAAFRAKWEQKCPDCGARDLVEDRSAGDLICRECGMVLEAHAIDEHSEWRTFADSDKPGADPNRVGGPTNPLLEDAALTTQIVAGKGDGGAAFALNRLAQHSDGRDRVLLTAFKEIARLCDVLNLNHAIKQRAQELFKHASEVPATKVRGSGNNAVYAAVVYIACRQENAPRSFKELLAAIPGTGVKEVGKYYKKILKGLSLGADVGVVNVVDYLRRFGSKLGLSPRELNVAEHIGSAACPKDGVRPDGATKPWDGKAPTSIAAAVLYLLCNHPKCSKCPTALHDLSLISGMANLTITNVYKDLLREAAVLLPPAFAAPEDVQKLPVP